MSSSERKNHRKCVYCMLGLERSSTLVRVTTTEDRLQRVGDPQCTYGDRELSSHEGGWFASSPCEWAQVLVDAEDERNQYTTQHSGSNTNTSTTGHLPKSAVTLKWPYSVIVPSWFLHCEDKTHTELIVSPQTGDSHRFPLFFAKNRNASALADTSSFSKEGMPKRTLGRQECSGLLGHSYLSRDRKGQINSISPAIFRDRFLHGDPPFSPGFLIHIFDNSWWDGTVSWLLLSLTIQREEPVCRCRAARHSWLQVLWYYLGSDVEKQRFSPLCLSLSF